MYGNREAFLKVRTDTQVMLPLKQSKDFVVRETLIANWFDLTENVVTGRVVQVCHLDYLYLVLGLDF